MHVVIGARLILWRSFGLVWFDGRGGLGKGDVFSSLMVVVAGISGSAVADVSALGSC